MELRSHMTYHLQAEKRSQQRINEMRERLEQANNTTRSMQVRNTK